MANRNTRNTNPKNLRGKLTKTKKKGFLKPNFRNNKVQDARQKILIKKRSGVTDARDILAKMAKTQDARGKLDKLREKKQTHVVNGNIKIIGNNIVRKTDRNGKISLSTNKSNPTNNIKLAIQRELGLVSQPRANVVKKPPMPVKRAIPTTHHISPTTIIRKQPVVYESIYEPLPSVFKWTNPAASHLISTIEQVPRKAEFLNRKYENFSINRPVQTRAYIDLDDVEDVEMPLEVSSRPSIFLQGTSRSSNIHSRLDTAPSALPESHGIFAQPKTKVVVPVGHRIVVSNLQNTVSQEDIKELFEDIGDLLAARLVRPGVAEVIFKNLKDAQKAVDTYHNRQLDGQPMKCLLVNKRPFNNPTAPAIPKSELEYADVPMQIASSEKLIPDISTIHKALFQRK